MVTIENRKKLETVLAKPDSDRITADEIQEQTSTTLNITTESRITKPLYRLPVIKDRSPPACKYAFLCAYNIALKPSPFLRYLLFKYPGQHGKMAFPIIAKDHKGGDSLIQDAKKMYEKCCGTDDLFKITIDGFIEHDDCVYMFCRNPDTLIVQESKSTQELWWSLISEICNERKVVTFDVHESVYRMFYQNPTACRLHYADGAPVPIPIPLYYGSEKKNLAYATAFGVQQADPYAMFGPFYYFAPLNRAARFALWNYSRAPIRVGTAQQDIHQTRSRGSQEDIAKHKDGGVIRYAVFTGPTDAMRVVTGHPKDPIDSSAITEKRKPRDSVLSENDKAKLSRVTDRNAAWAAQHDALYCGPVKSEKNEALLYHFLPRDIQNTYPQYVIKDFRQQVALSTHMLDADQAGEVWTNTHNYQIL